MSSRVRTTMAVVLGVGVSLMVLSAISAARRLDQLHRRIDMTRGIWEHVNETAAMRPSPTTSKSKVLAAHIYNDAVRETRRIRDNRIVRALRLAGTAPLPYYVDLLQSR